MTVIRKCSYISFKRSFLSSGHFSNHSMSNFLVFQWQHISSKDILILYDWFLNLLSWLINISHTLVPTRLDKMCTVTEIFNDQFFEFPLFQSPRNLSEETILNYLLLSPVEHAHKYIIHSLPKKATSAMMWIWYCLACQGCKDRNLANAVRSRGAGFVWDFERILVSST